MIVGCVKEIKKYEYRVGLTPDNVRAYYSHGHKVLLEKGAGEGSGFDDSAYSAAGAEIIASREEIWNRSEMLVKVKEPLEEEYSLLKKDQILFTYLHLAANRSLTEALLKSGTTAVAYETIRDSSGGLPLLKPMSEVAGRISIQEGAKCLENPSGGRGILLSGVPGVPRANVLIIGGGIVGSNACKIAAGFGAQVTIMDNNLARLQYLDDLFGPLVQTLYSQEAAIEREIVKADLVIGAVLIPGARTPRLIKKEYLSAMKKGSVIVDVAVDQGGCAETTRPTYHDNPAFTVNGVIHYCVANMPGAVAGTSTLALTNATLPYGLALADKGLEEAIIADPGLEPGVNVCKGTLTCKEAALGLDMAWSSWKPKVLKH